MLLQDVFKAPDLQDFSDDPLTADAWLILKKSLNGEKIPGKVLSHATAFLDTLETPLISWYVSEIRRKYYEKFCDDSLLSVFGNIMNMAEQLTALRFSFLEPFQNLLGNDSAVFVEDAFAALIRSSLDGEEFGVSLTEFLKSTRLFSATGSEIIHLLTGLGLGIETWQIVANLLPLEIREHVHQFCKGKWQISTQGQVLQWLKHEYIPGLEQVTAITVELESRLIEECNMSLAELRISEIFDMVENLPASEPGLIDLKNTMTTPALRASVVSTYQQSCSQRLLNEGVNTVDIFLGYLKCLKAFSLLDPRGVLLDKVERPIHRYLKERPDEVILLVDGLMGSPNSPLAFLEDELTVDTSSIGYSNDDLNDVNWVPDPIDAPADFVKHHTADVISTLLSLYDNKEILIKRLTQVFSERLLQVTSREDLRHLKLKAELLKKRFSERKLHHIDVMIEDISSSYDLNARIHQTHPSLTPIQAVVLSRLYWPNVEGTALQFPKKVEPLINEYAKEFEHVRKDRKVKWLPNLGRVSITVELQDRTIDIMVTPEQAILLAAFENADGQLSTEDLFETGLSKPVILSALRFWIDQGVIGSENEKYCILELAQEVNNVHVGNEPAMAVVQEDSFEDMNMYWSYIQHMLTNLGALPVDKIHSFLVMFVPKENPYVKTKEQLERFLHAMVTEEKLKLSDGKFALVS